MNVVIQLFLFDLNACNNIAEREFKQYRILEYSAVLKKNTEDPHIKRIYVLCETQTAADYYESVVNSDKKVSFIVTHHQPTYKELFEFIKDTIPKGEIVCLMNADIFFNSEKDHKNIQMYLQPHQLFSLTRHEITNDGHTECSLETCPFTGGGSSDTFIFYTPINSNLDTSKLDYCQNLFGAEAILHKVWFDAGYQIWNPCDDIITLHLHRGRIHFSQYQQLAKEYTDENSYCNKKTSLPPIPFDKNT